MISQILKSVDFIKRQKSRYLENETFLLQIKNSSRANFLAKNGFVAGVTYKPAFCSQEGFSTSYCLINLFLISFRRRHHLIQYRLAKKIKQERIIQVLIICSQTCSNNHLYKLTTRLRRPILNLPKPVNIQSLLYKVSTCLTQPVTTFFVPQMKKTCLKQPLQNFIQLRNG